MPKLNPSLIDRLFAYCSFRKTEDTDDAVVTEGVRNAWWGFHPGRLKEASELIRHFVLQLPKGFREEKDGGGGGWSFLNACVDSEGNQWGEHGNMEALIMLAMASKLMRPTFGRSRSKDLEGGMPFYTINALEGREMTDAGYKAWQAENAMFMFKLITKYDPKTADQMFHHWVQTLTPSEAEVKENKNIDHFTGLLNPAIDSLDPNAGAQLDPKSPDTVIAICSCGANIGMTSDVALVLNSGPNNPEPTCPKCNTKIMDHVYAAICAKACADVMPVDRHIMDSKLSPDAFTTMWMARVNLFLTETGVEARKNYDAFVAWVKDRMPDPEHLAVNQAYRAQMDPATCLMKVPASIAGQPVDKEDVGYTMLHDNDTLMQGDESAAYGGAWETVDDKFIGLTVGIARGGEDLKERGFRRKLPEVVA